MPRPVPPRLLTVLPLLTLVGFAPPRPAAAQEDEPGRVTLTVVDAVTGTPVRDARVEVAGMRGAVHTNGSGLARIVRVPAGNRIVEVRRLGYAPGRVAVEVAPGGTAEQTLRLEPEAVRVEGVAARAERRDADLERRGFYTRQRAGFGAFMTGEQVDFIRPGQTVDLFRRIRGFTVSYDRRGNPYLVTTRGTSGMSLQCSGLHVFVDDLLATSRLVSAAQAVNMVPPETIRAIEAYAGPATIPAQYNVTGSACGVVLIWTRTGA